jgi:hypothetical protein
MAMAGDSTTRRARIEMSVSICNAN